MALVRGVKAWEQDGLLAVLPGESLDVLATVTGVTQENVAGLPELLDSPVWQGMRPTVLVSGDLVPASLTRQEPDRGLAIRTLTDSAAEPQVVDAGPEFIPVLLAGYEVNGVVAAFIEAEHRLPEVHRFVVRQENKPIAAAAMTIHGEVAVLGGASTLRAHRGRGAQSALLRHRLHVAAQKGCTLAVATVVPDSVSARNLVRAGFNIHRRSAWTLIRCPS
jgi:GNAT superfamily N-acetyltransferase